MDSRTGKFKKMNQPLKTSEKPKGYAITQMIITDDGKYFACCDKNRTVCLFKKDHPQQDPNAPLEWMFNGKQLSHEIEVSSIAFGSRLDDQNQKEHILFSIGKDRRLFEYNVYASEGHTELVVHHCFFVEQEALPSCCIWYPKKDSKEDLLLTANDEYKMKVWNPQAKQSRKTYLGPTYGGEIKQMKILKVES